MTWVKTYEAFVFESKSSDIEKLEKLLKLPHNSGIFDSVMYNKNLKTLVIEQPKDLGSLDSGVVLGTINKEKSALKKEYSGIQKVKIGDLEITV